MTNIDAITCWRHLAAERDFRNAARSFARACGVRWPASEAAQAALIGDLCRWAAGSTAQSTGRQANRLLRAEAVLHAARSQS